MLCQDHLMNSLVFQGKLFLLPQWILCIHYVVPPELPYPLPDNHVFCNCGSACPSFSTAILDFCQSKGGLGLALFHFVRNKIGHDVKKNICKCF